MNKAVTLYLENGVEFTIYDVVHFEEADGMKFLRLHKDDGEKVVVNVDNVVYFSVVEEDQDEEHEETTSESEWINDAKHFYRCKNCGEVIKKKETHMFFGRYVFYDYCPMCGKKQRNGGEDVT